MLIFKVSWKAWQRVKNIENITLYHKPMAKQIPEQPGIKGQRWWVLVPPLNRGKTVVRTRDLKSFQKYLEMWILYYCLKLQYFFKDQKGMKCLPNLQSSSGIARFCETWGVYNVTELIQSPRKLWYLWISKCNNLLWF